MKKKKDEEKEEEKKHGDCALKTQNQKDCSGEGVACNIASHGLHVDR